MSSLHFNIVSWSNLLSFFNDWCLIDLTTLLFRPLLIVEFRHLAHALPLLVTVGSDLALVTSFVSCLPLLSSTTLVFKSLLSALILLVLFILLLLFFPEALLLSPLVNTQCNIISSVGTLVDRGAHTCFLVIVILLLVKPPVRLVFLGLLASLLFVVFGAQV